MIDKKNILITIGSVIGVFAFLFVVYLFVNGPTESVIYSEINKIQTNDNIKWQKNSKNLLIEYSDFQCPACKVYHQELAKLDKIATPNATLIFRHFPLSQIHNNAELASYAAQAASAQNKFWSMADLLYTNQETWGAQVNPKDTFISYVKKLNLDIEKFNQDINSLAIKNKIKADYSQGDKIGINATPTFFLNGKKLDNISPQQLINIVKGLK